MQQTCLIRYGETSYGKTDEFKNIWKDEKRKQKIKEKGYKTKKINNSFKKSTPEIKILELLKYYYPDTIYQYNTDKRYPFNCDFYIPSLDLFIEYNGHWTHQNHIFDKDNKNDLLILENMKNKSQKSLFYETAIQVWTIRDPLKLKIARENNLNYLILWTNDYKNNKILDKIKELM